MTSPSTPDQNYFPDDFGPMIETAQLAGLTLIANAIDPHLAAQFIIAGEQAVTPSVVSSQEGKTP